MLRKSRKWKKHLHAWTSAVIKRGKKGLIFLLSPLLHNNLFPFKNYTNNVLGFWLNPLWFYESLDVWSDVLLNYSCFQLGSKIQLWSFNSFVFYCIFKLNYTIVKLFAHVRHATSKAIFSYLIYFNMLIVF